MRKKTTVKILNLVRTTLALTIIPCQAIRAADQLFLAALPDPQGLCTFSVPWVKLPSRVRWEAEGQAFPVKLEAAVNEAKSFIAAEDHLTNELRLVSLRIHRIAFPRWKVSHPEGDPSAYSNQWIIVCSFMMLPVNPRFRYEKHTVMLLDGSFASKRISKPLTAESTMSDEAHLDVNDSLSPLAQSQSNNLSDPQGELATPLSQVQWEPSLQPFPLDLSAESQRAMHHLFKKYDVASLRLTEIIVARSDPTEQVINLLNLNRALHRGHWLVTFHYDMMPPSIARHYYVSMRLDGTITSTWTD